MDEWGVERLTNPLSGFQWQEMTAQFSNKSRSESVRYIKVAGRRSDYSGYHAYFVYQDNSLVLDWQATIGWSEFSFDELLQSKPRRAVSVRCLLKKQPGYDIRLNGTTYSGYLISSSGNDPKSISNVNPFFKYKDIINNTIPHLQTLEGTRIKPHLDIMSINSELSKKPNNRSFGLYLINRVLL